MPGKNVAVIVGLFAWALGMIMGMLLMITVSGSGASTYTQNYQYGGYNLSLVQTPSTNTCILNVYSGNVLLNKTFAASIYSQYIISNMPLNFSCSSGLQIR